VAQKSHEDASQDLQSRFFSYVQALYRGYRARYAVTQEELAKQLGVERSYLSQVLHGKGKVPSLEFCKRLVQVLELSPQQQYRLLMAALQARVPEIIELAELGHDLIIERSRRGIGEPAWPLAIYVLPAVLDFGVGRVPRAILEGKEGSPQDLKEYLKFHELPCYTIPAGPLEWRPGEGDSEPVDMVEISETVLTPLARAPHPRWFGLVVQGESLVDAGIADGDVVRVFNDKGEIILPAYATSRVLPGVVLVRQGAWYSPDGGIAPHVLLGEYKSPVTPAKPTTLVEVEKVMD
jgi:transcriptional regulator with XRE-family HTH domain